MAVARPCRCMKKCQMTNRMYIWPGLMAVTSLASPNYFTILQRNMSQSVHLVEASESRSSDVREC